MTNEQQHLISYTAQGFWACAYNLYMRIWLDHPEIMDHSSPQPLHFYWRDTVAISVNLGLALELFLKLLLYQDCKKAVKTHCLSKLYGAMSPELKKMIGNIYRDTLKAEGGVLLTFVYAASVKQLKKLPKHKLHKPPKQPSPKKLDTLSKLLNFIDKEPPKQPSPKKLDTLSKLLNFIDKERLLFEKRYESFDFDSNKWYPFFERLFPLFSFVTNISYVRKSSNGEWEYHG